MRPTTILAILALGGALPALPALAQTPQKLPDTILTPGRDRPAVAPSPANTPSQPHSLPHTGPNSQRPASLPGPDLNSVAPDHSRLQRDGDSRNQPASRDAMQARTNPAPSRGEATSPDVAIKAAQDSAQAFDPSELTVGRIEGRYQLHTRSRILRDFGNRRAEAFEAARILHDLRVNRVGTIPGSHPPFEFWLVDDRPPQPVNTRVVMIPIATSTIRAEPLGGAWLVTDGQRMLYNFGTDADAARTAAAILAHYGFNQLAIVGTPEPIMLIPMVDPIRKRVDRGSPPPPAPLAVIDDAARSGLFLPGNVYAGPKSSLDLKTLEIRRDPRGWVLLHHGLELARFGSDESTARAALKTLQLAHANEIVRVGQAGFPIVLSDGGPIRGEPLGIPKVPIRPDSLKVQKLRETYWLFDENRPVLEVGTQSDAELLRHVIRTLGLKSMVVFGRPESGGLRLFTAGR